MAGLEEVEISCKMVATKQGGSGRMGLDKNLCRTTFLGSCYEQLFNEWS